MSLFRLILLKWEPIGAEPVFGALLIGIPTQRTVRTGGRILREASGEPMPVITPHIILLVEDEIFIRIAMAGDLMDAGFQVIQAATADEALKLLQSAIKVNLVLTDINMPGALNGCDLADMIHARWPEIKVIIVSAHYNGMLATTPADAFVAKPYFLPLLIGTIHRLLDISDVNPARRNEGGGWIS